jgi:uncharacterized protein DUF3298/peptidoglycan-N-acetylmuramic acid deacetylase PdaC-like protein
MKKTFSLLISITLFLSVVVMGQSNGGTNAGASLPSTQRNGAVVRFVPRQIRAANRRLRYTVKAKYPQAIGEARDLRLAKLNQELRNLVTKEVNEFKSYFTEPQERTGPTGSYYESEYWATLATNEVVSLAFGISTYGEGAAHPNHNTLVFNYDLNAGRVLKLSDLFKPNSGYLSVISRYTIEELKKKFSPDPDMEWIEKGAGASEENYKAWNLTLSGLQITFDPYQVASYAEGEHTVVIPYSVLKNLIDPNGPLARMAGRN